jgi:RNA polymerase sigma-70 factor (ECF subfamily)
MRTDAKHERLTDWFQLFRRWRLPLRKLWLLTESDLDDVAQEVFLRLLRYDNVDLIEHPQAYLLRMAANVLGERTMRSRHRHTHDARWLEDLQAESDPECEAARESAHGHLHDVLASLPPRQQEVLRLHFGEGLTRAQIADRIKTSERSVKRDLIGAYARLRTVLHRDQAGRPELLDGLE